MATFPSFPNINDANPCDSCLIKVVSLERSPISDKNSNIVTLKPFENISNRQRQTRYKPDPTLTHFNILFDSDSWSRFFILKPQAPITAAKLELLPLSVYTTRDMSFR